VESYTELYPGQAKYAPDSFRNEIRVTMRDLQREAGLTARDEDPKSVTQEPVTAVQGGFEWKR
jgi:hypothetical protein